MNKKRTINRDDLLFDIVTGILTVFFILIVLYPLYFVVIASVSDPTYVNNGTVVLWPRGFTLMGYKKIFTDSSILVGYANTLIYAGFGTFFGVCCTMLSGYALSRKDLPGRNIVMLLFIFTMYFQGGMIPFYLVIKGLNLVNTRIFMILAGSISVYNIIITRSFLAGNISDELLEAARIDGCGNGRFFFRIVMPLSKAIVAVIALYIAVVHWNSYFNAMIFLTDESKYPLQLFLRDILLTASSTINATSEMDPEAAVKLQLMGQVIKYGVIVVSTVPIICVYPFIQKYFVKGVMIGSVKG